jgi:hypothetical protein
VPAVNPNRNRYSGNLSSGGYKQPKIAKGPGDEPWLDGALLGCCHAGAAAVLPRWCGAVLLAQGARVHLLNGTDQTCSICCPHTCLLCPPVPQMAPADLRWSAPGL